MNNESLRLPASFVDRLNRISPDQPVVILLRHAERGALPIDGGDAYSLPITDEGVRQARALGTEIRGRLKTLHTSPLARCVQTAEAMKEGALVDIPVVRDRLLGDPGVYVVDGKAAWANWQAMGNEGVVEHLVSSDIPLPGMAAPNAAAINLVMHMLNVAGTVAGLHVFVTHDSLIAVTVARMVGCPRSAGLWPYFLEGAFFWFDEFIYMDYRNSLRQVNYPSFRCHC